jgi:hypothetical protein
MEKFTVEREEILAITVVTKKFVEAVETLSVEKLVGRLVVFNWIKRVDIAVVDMPKK